MCFHSLLAWCGSIPSVVVFSKLNHQFPQDINNTVIVLSGSFLLYTRRHPKYYNVEVSKLSSTSKRSCRWNNEYFSLMNGFIQVVNMVYLHVKLTMSRCFHVLSKLSFTAFSFGYPLSSINILGSSLREFYSWKQSCIH